MSSDPVRWTTSFERRVALYEEYAASAAARLEQLARERTRGVAPLARPLPMVEQAEQLCRGTIACAACRRDFCTQPGPELITADGGTVCWACGRAGLPTLAALVLADAADHAEQAAIDVCHSTSAFLIEAMCERGNGERANVLQRRIVAIQALLRDSRRHRHTDPWTWLQLSLPALAWRGQAEAPPGGRW